jgi:Zn-dependent peptidase ImmA (M78 family)
MAGLHTNRGAKRAREAREELGLAPAEPPTCILTLVEERAKLPVVVTAALPSHVAGACYRDGDGTLLWVNGAQAPVRQRFTLAHELAHAWCRHDGELEVDTFETLSGRTTNDYEIQANAFAAELLMPKACMHELVTREPTLEEVVVIGAHLGVSAIAVVYRIKQLGLASEARIDQLEQEIDDNLHEATFARLDLSPLDDRIAAAVEHLPYLSPALNGSELEAAVRGEVRATQPIASAVSRMLI